MSSVQRELEIFPFAVLISSGKMTGITVNYGRFQITGTVLEYRGFFMPTDGAATKSGFFWIYNPILLLQRYRSNTVPRRPVLICGTTGASGVNAFFLGWPPFATKQWSAGQSHHDIKRSVIARESIMLDLAHDDARNVLAK